MNGRWGAVRKLQPGSGAIASAERLEGPMPEEGVAVGAAVAPELRSLLLSIT